MSKRRSIFEQFILPDSTEKLFRLVHGMLKICCALQQTIAFLLTDRKFLSLHCCSPIFPKFAIKVAKEEAQKVLETFVRIFAVENFLSKTAQSGHTESSN